LDDPALSHCEAPEAISTDLGWPWPLDPMFQWNANPSAEHCASCAALDAQLHYLSDWDKFGVRPRDGQLFCDGYCRCTLDPVPNETPRGDLDLVPLRDKPPKERLSMPDYETEHRLTLQAAATVQPDGRFEILAITTGAANGWTFTEESLRKSLALWEGVDVFVDHEGFFSSHSVRDLGGVAHSPTWDDLQAGVRLQLDTTGPSGPLIAALGREMLKDGPKPKVGFSADLIFTAQDKKVQDILRIHSLDLVFRPARGGAFLRALNSLKEENMPDTAIHSLHESASEIPAGAADPLAEIRDTVLDAALAGSRLPPPVQSQVRERFTGRSWSSPQLQAEIESARKLISALTGPAAVVGPRVTETFTTEDQLQAALDDLLGAPRNPEHKGLKPHRLTGIRELYHSLTGDFDLHGGYHPERARFATTADFTGLVKNALNKIVVNQWDMLGRAGYNWWQRIVREEDFPSLNGVTGTLVGTVGALPVVAEQGEYTELQVGDSPETGTFVKYGAYVPLTLEMIDRDESRKLAQYPRELASSALRRLSQEVSDVFTDASGTGPTLADGGVLFNATAVTTAGGHANLLTTALSAAQWETVSQAVYKQPQLIKNAAGLYGTGPRLAVRPKFLLVPIDLDLTARQIIYPNWERATNIVTENLQQGSPDDVVVVPEWTDTTDWAAAVDPRIAPAIYVGYRFGRTPEVFIAGDEQSPAVFMNDEHRLKVRFFIAVWVNDFRPLHKSNV